MGLRFILGPAGSGKTQHILDAAREEISKSPLGPPVFILVPEQSVALAERALFSGPVVGSFRARMTSFRRLAHLGRSLSGRTGEPAGTLFESLVARAACESEKPKFRYYGNVEVTTGFVRAVVNTLRELRRYRAHKFAPNLGRVDSSFAKFSDLSAVERVLRQSLPPGRCLSDDLLEDLIEALSEWDGLAESRLFVDGFSTFTGQEEEALLRLIGKVKSAEVALCLDPSNTPEEGQDLKDRLFSPTEETYLRVKKRCESAGIPLEPAKILPEGRESRFHGSPELARMESAWRGEEVPPDGDGTGGLRLATCPDREAEVRFTADEILRLVQDRGYRFRDVGVIVRSLPPFEGLIQREFSRKNIPFLMPGRSSIEDHPATILLRTTARVLNDGWEEESVRDYLKNDLCPVERDEADRLEKALIREGIFEEKLFENDQWSRFGEESVELKDILLRAFGPLRDLERDLAAGGGTNSPRGLAESLIRYLTALQVTERFERRDVDREESQWVWSRVVSLIDDLLAAPDTAIRTEILLDGLVEALEETGGPASPITLDHVSVGAVDRSRMGDLRVVFVLGMNEGAFPAPVSENTLLDDQDRIALRGLGISLGPTSLERLSHEAYLAYVALSRPSELLIVTRALNDDEGHPLNPSPYFERLAEMLPASAISEIPSEIHVPSPDEIRHVADYASAYLRSVTRKEKFAPKSTIEKGEGEVRLFSSASSPETWDAIRNALQGEVKIWRFGSPFDSLNYSNKAHLSGEPVAGDLKGSVSSLAEYAFCPFRYYAARTLSLREPDVHEPDPRDSGTLMHSVLERLFRGIEKDGLDWSDLRKERIPRLVEEAVDFCASRHRHGLFLSTGSGRHTLNTLRRHLVDLVEELVDRAKVSKFRQISAELTFGMGESSLPELRLPIEGGGVLHMRGKIDRLDWDRESKGFAVIDYKLSDSGVGPIDPARFEAGLEIQLLSYLLVLKELGSDLFGSDQAKPSAAFYLNVARGPTSTNAPSEERLVAPRKARGILADSAAGNLETSCESGYSRYYSFQIKKDGDLGKTGDHVPDDYLGRILHRLPEILANLGKQILRRNIAVRPYLYGGDTPCGNCSFLSLCRLDVGSGYGGYRRIKKSRWEEVVKDVNHENYH